MLLNHVAEGHFSAIAASFNLLFYMGSLGVNFGQLSALTRLPR